MSGIFGMAAAFGRCAQNPIRDAKVLARPKAPGETGAYTIEEVKAALKALESDPEASLAFALSAVQALRPSELIALKVEDIEGDEIHVVRAFVRGKYLGETKTDGAAKVKLIEPARALLIRVCKGRADGWVFPHPRQPERPLDVNELARKRIKPNFVKAGVPWQVSGRRSSKSDGIQRPIVMCQAPSGIGGKGLKRPPDRCAKSVRISEAKSY
jgi:integrase